jgi:hypothetical protein
MQVMGYDRCRAKDAKGSYTLRFWTSSVNKGLILDFFDKVGHLRRGPRMPKGAKNLCVDRLAIFGGGVSE